MSIFLGHKLTLRFANSQSITRDSLIETTGLLVNAFVEGNALHDQTYEYFIECEAPNLFSIQAKLRHPLEENRVAQERAYTPLFVIFSAWFLAGADVEINGPWKDTFPGHGALHHEAAPALRLRPIFEDELPTSARTVYPTLETLAEIHGTLAHSACWKQVQEDATFRTCFPSVVPNEKAPNNIRLRHRNGLWLDVILDEGLIASHILECIQPEIEIRYISCNRETFEARTWWDAWIDHCPSSSLTPKQLWILPSEVALLSSSGSIWRYKVQDMTTLERHSKIDFGDGVHPTRSIESWLQSARQFGEAGFVELAIACCEQALASATAMNSKLPGLDIKLPLGVSAQQQLRETEIEYLRWLDSKESLDKPAFPHDRRNEQVHCKGLHELTRSVGSQWEAALQEFIQAVDFEHNDAHDYRHPIGLAPQFMWNVDGEIGTLRYHRIFGRAMMDAKVPKKAMSLLGYEFREEVIPTYVEFADIFTLTLGKVSFWGSVEQRVLVSCEEPSQAYLI